MSNNFEPNDFTGMFDTNDINQNKAVSAVAYIPLLFLIPLLAAGNSSFARFHANQGLILTIFTGICAVVTKLIGFIIGWIPVIGWLIDKVVMSVLGIAVIAYIVIGIINAVQGKAKKLPLIGDFLDAIK